MSQEISLLDHYFEKDKQLFKGVYNRLAQITYPDSYLSINSMCTFANLILALIDLTCHLSLVSGGHACQGNSILNSLWLILIISPPKLSSKVCSFEKNQIP